MCGTVSIDVDEDLHLRHPWDDGGTVCMFYAAKLGFHLMRDAPLGEYRWLTHSSGTWVLYHLSQYRAAFMPISLSDRAGGKQVSAGHD